MNERIKELAKQVDACYIPRYDMWQMDTETMEKFAELIVQECAGIVQTYMSRWPEDAELTKQIKEHFGVEE